MSIASAVVPIRALSDDEALVWLAAHSPVRQGGAELARLWGWSATKVSRRLKAWESAGKIARGKGGLTVAAAAGASAPPIMAQSVVPQPVLSHPWVSRPLVPDPLVAQPVVPQSLMSQPVGSQLPALQPMESPSSVSQPAPAPAPAVAAPSASAAPSISVRLAAVVLVATTLVLGAIGLVLNARFAASFGQSTEASFLLAGIGLAIDVLALVLPVAAVALWRQRRYLAASGAWLIWLGAIVMTLLAASGFASTHIGDAVAGRSKNADQSVATTERLQRLRSERTHIAERRSVATIDAELQAAQPGAGAVWRATEGCTDVTRPESARVCAPIQRLRQARGEAVRRDAIDAEVRELEDRLARMPAVTVGDPGAAMATELVTWLSAGTLQLTERDVQRMRILGLMAMPSLAGLLLGFAMLMTGRREPLRPASGFHAT